MYVGIMKPITEGGGYNAEVSVIAGPMPLRMSST